MINLILSETARTHKMISIILPTYNEAGNIVPLIASVKKNIKSDFEIIVVDDNSTDGTYSQAKKIKDRRIKVYLRKNEKGLASAIHFGIRKSKGEIIAVMDTDFNHDPKEIPVMRNKLKYSDFVVGSRYIKNGGMENKLRYLLSLLYNWFAKIVLSLPTYDSLSGFFLIKRKKLLTFDLNRIFIGYGDYFLRLIYCAKNAGFSITETPVYYKNRLRGESKSSFLPMFLTYTKTIFDLLRQ